MKLKINYPYTIVVAILIIAILSFKTNDPIKQLRDEMNNKIDLLRREKSGEIAALKRTLSTQAENLNQQISDMQTIVSDQKSGLIKQMNELALKSLPVGSIIAFDRDAMYIPSGWVLCDGKSVNDANSSYNNKTVPNLADYFVRGKKSSESLRAKGGADKISGHAHNMSHVHSFATDNSSISNGGSCANGISCRSESGQKQYLLFANSESEYQNITSHNHSGTTYSSSSAFTGYSAEETNIPEYVSLNYIIKIR